MPNKLIKSAILWTIALGLTANMTLPNVAGQTSESSRPNSQQQTGTPTNSNHSLTDQVDSVSGFDYAPYLFYRDFDYYGTGNEFAGYKVTLDYPLNEDGVYQFRMQSSGTTIVYVYQLREEGLVELAYFPETYELVDLRQHPDSLDDLYSLILPNQLKIGDNFKSGYSQQSDYQVADIYPTYQVGESTYENVVVLTLSSDPETQSYFYLAPGVGYVDYEFVFKDDDMYSITEVLKSAKNPLDYSGLNLAKSFDLPEKGVDIP